MKLRPRLLPAVIVAATALLGLKVTDIFSGGGGGVALDARAQASSPAPAPQGQPIDLTKEANNDGNKHPPDSAAAAAPPAPATAAPQSPIKDPLLLSPSELEVLQQLSQRRVALDQRAGELDRREVLLQATEKRIDDKIVKLTALQKGIADDVQKRAAADDAHIQGLVKIYEAMKPKDAAQIMEQLDLPVVLDVIERMKEAKVAPMMAAMDPLKAKAITMAVAAEGDRKNTPTAPAQAGAPQANP